MVGAVGVLDTRTDRTAEDRHVGAVLLPPQSLLRRLGEQPAEQPAAESAERSGNHEAVRCVGCPPPRTLTEDFVVASLAGLIAFILHRHRLPDRASRTSGRLVDRCPAALSRLDSMPTQRAALLRWCKMNVMTATTFKTIGIVLLAMAALVVSGMIGFDDYGSSSFLALISSGCGGVASLLRARELNRQSDAEH